MEFENPLVVTLDNKLVYETVIGGEEDMKLYDQVQNGALDRVNARLKNIRFFATAGPHRIGVAFKRRTLCRVRRSAADVRARRRPGSLVSREFVPAAGAVQREGHRSDAEPRADLQLPPRRCTADAQDACAKQIITSLATRAYRRPVSAEDVNELLAVLPGRREGRRLRGRHPQRHHRSAGEPVLSVSRRARPRGAAPRRRPTRSAISSSPRTCRSSSGTRSPTTSCCSSASTASSASPPCSTGRCGACSPIRVR